MFLPQHSMLTSPLCCCLPMMQLLQVPAHSAHNNNHGWGRPAYEPRAPPTCGSYNADGQQGRCPPNRPLNNMAPQHQRSSNNAWTAPNEQVRSLLLTPA